MHLFAAETFSGLLISTSLISSILGPVNFRIQLIVFQKLVFKTLDLDHQSEEYIEILKGHFKRSWKLNRIRSDVTSKRIKI